MHILIGNESGTFNGWITMFYNEVYSILTNEGVYFNLISYIMLCLRNGQFKTL